MTISYLSFICFLLLFINYGIRYNGLKKGSFQAHPGTWLVTSISCFAQAAFIYSNEANFFLFLQIMITGFFDLSILIWGVYNIRRDGLKGWKFTKVDVILLVVSMVCVIYYLQTSQAEISAIVLFIANAVAVSLQWKKSVYAPKTELPITNIVAIVRCILMTFIASNVDVIVSLNTWIWAIIELISLLSVGIGVLRRNRIGGTEE